MLAWGCDVSSLREFVPFSWYEIAGDNDNNHLKFHLGLLGNSHCVSIVNSFRGVWAYASKYLGKTFKVSGWDEGPTGRFWAVVNRENIPFGREMVMRVTVKNSHVWMRYQKRFAKLKSRDYSSITTFCDAEQWIKNFLTSEVKAEENI